VTRIYPRAISAYLTVRRLSSPRITAYLPLIGYRLTTSFLARLSWRHIAIYKPRHLAWYCRRAEPRAWYVTLPCVTLARHLSPASRLSPYHRVASCSLPTRLTFYHSGASLYFTSQYILPSSTPVLRAHSRHQHLAYITLILFNPPSSPIATPVSWPSYGGMTLAYDDVGQ